MQADVPHPDADESFVILGVIGLNSRRRGGTAAAGRVLQRCAYVECSFVELYAGQALAADVIAYCAEYGLTLAGIYNPSYDTSGQAIQADLISHA